MAWPEIIIFLTSGSQHENERGIRGMGSLFPLSYYDSHNNTKGFG